MSLIKISFRNLWKNKYSAIINLFGLTIALISFTFTAMWVYSELTFDKFHKNYRDIYMVGSEWKFDDGKSDFIMETPTPMQPFIKENFPEVKSSTRFAKQFGGRYIEKLDKKFLEQGLAIEPSFFDVFSIDMINGNRNEIENPDAIFISKSLSNKFFGNTDSMGQELTYYVEQDSIQQFQVAGIFNDLPANSSLQFDFLIPVSVDYKDNWFAFGYTTFLLAPNGLDESKLNQKLAGFYKDKDLGFNIKWYLHPLSRMHFHSDYQQFVHHPGNIQYVYIFSLAGIFILLIAVINFVGLMATILSKRLKEVGLRKLSGAAKIRLVGNFLFEPIILAVLALVMTMGLVELFQPQFNTFLNSELPSIYDNYAILFFLIAIMLVIAIISGIVPGILFSALRPMEAINQLRRTNAQHFRKLMIGVQLVLSIILLSATFMIYKQMHFIFRKDLGFQKEDIVHIPLKGRMGDEHTTMKTQLLENPQIEHVTNASPLLSSGIEVPGWTWNGNSTGEKRSIAQILADEDFLKTYGISLVKGSYFRKGIASPDQVIINEEAAKAMGMTNPVDRNMQIKGKDYQIVGVVRNFHSRHFSNEIRPLAILWDDKGHNLYAKISPAADRSSVLSSIKGIYDAYEPDFSFEYRFLDDEFTAIYRDENRMLDLLSYFAFVAFLILCFGLYTLSKQIAMNKTKEIGIRKVNGAMVFQVVSLLNKGFVQWVVMAFIIAVPIAYLLMERWLQGFSYKTSLSWWVFMLSGLITLAISLITVSWQSWKAATMNPVDALRNE